MEDRDKKEGNRAAGFAFSVTEVIGYSSSTNKPYSMLLVLEPRAEHGTPKRYTTGKNSTQNPESHGLISLFTISATTKPFYFPVVLYLFSLSVCISN